jgi:nitronate monooxygenase
MEDPPMATLPTPLCELLGIDVPIIQAPMAGGAATPELVAAVSAAGALGSFGHTFSGADAMRADAAAVRTRTPRPFGINLFATPIPPEPAVAAQRPAIEALRRELDARQLPVPERVPPPYAPVFDEQLDAVCELRPAVFTTHLGDLTRAAMARLRDAGIRIGGAATSVAEARHLEAGGVDFVVAQGAEAGGHRGTFLGDADHAMTGTLALVRQIVHTVRVPVVAAGGIMDGAGVAAVLALGAQAAQLGTAFLVCAESGASLLHKKAVSSMDGDETIVTRAFTGKPARAIRNRFAEAAERERWPMLPFPVQAKLTGALRAASEAAGSIDQVAAWSGQAGSLARPLPAAELVRLVTDEAIDAIERLRRVLAP